MLGEAHRLARPLLLVHGLADTNVRPVHTLRLSEALLLPGTGHQPIGTDLTGNLLGHQVRLLRHRLGPYLRECPKLPRPHRENPRLPPPWLTCAGQS